MSIANQLKTHVFDPTIFDQRRCEFRIPKGVYLSNLRLGNIGCTVDNGKGSARVKYPWHVGAYSIIQRLSLLSGNVEIAELNYAGDYLAFANQNRTNANAYNVARSLNRSNWGFTTADYEDVSQSSKVEQDSDRITVKRTDNTLSQIESDSIDTPKGWLDLSLPLPFLKATPHLNCNTMDNVRLVIEWVVIPNQTQEAAAGATDGERKNADKAFNKYLVGKSACVEGRNQTIKTTQGAAGKDVVMKDVSGLVVGMTITGTNIAGGTTIDSINVTTSTITMSVASQNALQADAVLVFESVDSRSQVLTNFQIIQPTLIADEIVDEGALKKVKNAPITHVNLDHEVVNLPALTTATKITQQRLRGFNDKMVRRLLMVNKYHEDEVHNVLGSFQSPALTNETHQYMLNGSKLLPHKGITNANENLAMLNDTWGSRCQPQASHLPNLTSSQNFITPWSEHTATAERSNVGTQLCGKLSYSGLNINQRVEELIYEHSRDARATTAGKLENPTLKATLTTEENDGIAGVVKFKTKYAFDVQEGQNITIAGTSVNNCNGDKAVVPGFRIASERNAADKYRPVFGYGFILNKTGVEPTLTDATVKATTPAEYQSIADSKKAIDKMFWGECVKTLNVSNKAVSINY